MNSDELLEMKLAEISDLMLCKLTETGEDTFQVNLPGCNVKTKERFTLTVSLTKGENINGSNRGIRLQRWKMDESI